MRVDLESISHFDHSLKPFLKSYDSGEECSLFHWVEVCKLVDECDDAPAKAEAIAELSASEV